MLVTDKQFTDLQEYLETLSENQDRLSQQIGLLKTQIAAIKQPAIPEGFTPWHGGECPCPGAEVEVIRCDGVTLEPWPAECRAWSKGDSNYNIIAYRITKPAPLKWPVWVPTNKDTYYSAYDSGPCARTLHWVESIYDKNSLANANVYQTEAEAIVRFHLDKRLAIHAMLRQLGGGDEGQFVIRYGGNETKQWDVYDCWAFSAGDARFVNEESAQAALDALKAAGKLVDGEAQ